MRPDFYLENSTSAYICIIYTIIFQVLRLFVSFILPVQEVLTHYLLLFTIRIGSRLLGNTVLNIFVLLRVIFLLKHERFSFLSFNRKIVSPMHAIFFIMIHHYLLIYIYIYTIQTTITIFQIRNKNKGKKR